MRQQKFISGRKLMIFLAILMLNGLNSMSGFCGIMQSEKLTSSTPQTIEEAQTQAYGSKPTIAVMEFDNKSGANYESGMFGGHGNATFGSGMKEQLVTALAQTNAFILVERQAIKDVMAEHIVTQIRFSEIIYL